MEYTFLKDDTPENTVQKIKGILENVGIKLEEKYLEKEHNKEIDSLYSLRVYINGYEQFGTNGKGISIEKARASAYAEFMERLQNFSVFSSFFNKKIQPPDIKSISEREFLEEYNKYFNDDVDYTLQIKNLSNKIYLDSNVMDVSLVPFYSIKQKKVVYLPIDIIKLLQTSNGMAAGNTIEEAIVQGLSEICERYATQKVIINRDFLIKISRNMVFKYQKIKEMIEYLETLNYSIDVFDASVSLSLPVICVLIKNNNTNSITYKFGAHPSFPIAIERCLTEFAQGVDFLSEDNLFNTKKEFFISKNKLSFYKKENKLDLLYENFVKRRYDFEDCIDVRTLFSCENSQIMFDENIWLGDCDYTNKQILNFLLKKIKNVTNDIYIRNTSFLGFPSVYIYIPEMSIDYHYNSNRINIMHNLYNSFYLKSNVYENELSLKEFFYMIELRFLMNSDYHPFVQISKLSNEFILLLCSIVLNDYYNIEKYSTFLLDKQEQKGVLSNSYVKIIKENYSLKSKNIDEIDIDKILLNSYFVHEVKKVKSFIKRLNFNSIKKLIDNNKIDITKKIEKIENDEYLQAIINNFMEAVSKSSVSQLAIKECIDNL